MIISLALGVSNLKRFISSFIRSMSRSIVDGCQYSKTTLSIRMNTGWLHK